MTGEGPFFGGSRSTGNPAYDDVVVVDTIESDEEVDRSDDDEGESEDTDFNESEGEVVAFDGGDDEVDDGESEDEGVRPRRLVERRML